MIVERIAPDLDPADRTKPGGCPKCPISAQLKLGSTLRFLAGSNHLDIADLHAMSPASFYSHLYKVIDAINNCFADEMRFPQTAAELEEQSRIMSDNWGALFLGCVAALDGLAVHVRKPHLADAPMGFMNRKGSFSVNVQAMANGNRKFLMMSAEHQGACNDSIAWTTCQFFTHPTAGLRVRGLKPPYFIVADAAYALTDYLLTPYDGKSLPPDKDAYNFWHSHYRINIECAFGLLQRRWGIFRRDMEVDTHRVGFVVKACMLLHNLCIEEGDHPVNPVYDSERNFVYGLDLQSDGFADEEDELERSAVRANKDVPLRLRMRNRLALRGIVRPARGRLGSSNRRSAAARIYPYSA
ncbi:hypothetical protein KFE25_004788 [Diacronema lutheri]|uniref:DDE Tnp4 domain-containing protein n=1 Tax=Diacronema lutheri TaxID=2081491 RepID=A0A8J5XKN4_DIALT|nr:hypothetical protein KFE25_004788 [Diacronema lutheri]